MARAGRKSNSAAKRKQTTRKGQGRNEQPIEPLLRRIEAAGVCLLPKLARVPTQDDPSPWRTPRYRDVKAVAERIGVLRAGPAYPLDMLEAAGQLIEGDEDAIVGRDRADAGARFASLHWRIYGFPVQAQANGYRSAMNDEEMQAIMERAKRLDVEAPLTLPEREWLDSAKYRAMRGALIRRGMIVEATVIRVVAHCERPGFHEFAALRAGLQAIFDVPLPGRSVIPDYVRLAG